MTKDRQIGQFRRAGGVQVDRQLSPGRMGWMLTAGAAALALMLGVALPVRAAGVERPLFDTAPRGAEPFARPAPEPEPAKSKRRKNWQPTIPAACAFVFESDRRDVTVYSERCLIRSGVEVRLPEHCAKPTRIRGKRDRVYSERCLREAGFRLEADAWRRDGFGPGRRGSWHD